MSGRCSHPLGHRIGNFYKEDSEEKELLVLISLSLVALTDWSS
jgi:hypothetical protein